MSTLLMTDKLRYRFRNPALTHRVIPVLSLEYHRGVGVSGGVPPCRSRVLTCLCHHQRGKQSKSVCIHTVTCRCAGAHECMQSDEHRRNACMQSAGMLTYTLGHTHVRARTQAPHELLKRLDAESSPFAIPQTRIFT